MYNMVYAYPSHCTVPIGRRGYHFHTSIIKLNSFPLSGIWNGSGLSVMFPVPTFDQEDTNASIQPFLLNISYIVCVYRSRRRRGEINKQHISLLDRTSVFFISYYFSFNWFFFFFLWAYKKFSHFCLAHLYDGAVWNSMWDKILPLFFRKMSNGWSTWVCKSNC